MGKVSSILVPTTLDLCPISRNYNFLPGTDKRRSTAHEREGVRGDRLSHMLEITAVEGVGFFVKDGDDFIWECRNSIYPYEKLVSMISKISVITDPEDLWNLKRM